MLNLAQIVHHPARYTPERIAMRFGEATTTYAQLDALAGRVARYLLEQGLTPGDKVALSCPNLPYFPIVYFGILRAGMVVVPLNVLLKPGELAYHLANSEAKAYFVFEGTPQLPMAQWGQAAFNEAPECEHLVVITADPEAAEPGGLATLGSILAQGREAPLAATDATDTAVILYTSGTTGKPKGAELSHFNMFMNAMVTSELATDEEASARDNVYLQALPLFHSFGQTTGMNAMFYGGGQIVLLPRFEAGAALKLIENCGVTLFAGVPTMYWALLGEAAKMSPEARQAAIKTLKYCLSGGSAMPVELLKRFEEAFEVKLLEGYGLSETSPVASFNHKERPRKVGTIGQPVWGIEMKVVGEDDEEVPLGQPGEIVIRGHNVMKGYYRQPEDSARALRGGWFHSGDIGTVDEDGYFTVIDRTDDMINRGGFNVYPREIEELLLTHPAVSLAAVVGVPDAEHGQEIKAFVVLQDGAALTSEEVVAWSRERLAAYKYPRAVEFREALPLGATGKVLRRELRE